jgi:hypothetical protein
MSQLTIAVQPGFFDLADSTLVGGQPLTDTTLTEISHNAKFGAVRHEKIYMGYYASGNTISPPQSPVDGYQYSYPECSFSIAGFCSRAPAPGFTPGQAAFPAIANTNQGASTGTILMMAYDINDANGLVTITMDYWANSQEYNTNDGFVKVFANCQRSSLTLPVGVSGD